MTQTFEDSDLLALRDAVARLGYAVSTSDLASVEATTLLIKDLMERQPPMDPLVAKGQLQLVEELNASSQEIAALLASRLRAFDIAIAAWRDPDPGL